jgi:hypothetical protein
MLDNKIISNDSVSQDDDWAALQQNLDSLVKTGEYVDWTELQRLLLQNDYTPAQLINFLATDVPLNSSNKIPTGVPIAAYLVIAKVLTKQGKAIPETLKAFNAAMTEYVTRYPIFTINSPDDAALYHKLARAFYGLHSDQRLYKTIEKQIIGEGDVPTFEKIIAKLSSSWGSSDHESSGSNFSISG